MLKIVPISLKDGIAVDVDPGTKNALVVASKDLLQYEFCHKYFNNDTYGIEMNQNGETSGIFEDIYKDGSGKFYNYLWATTSNLNNLRTLLAGSGNTVSSLAFGGYDGSNDTTYTEIWNILPLTTSWTITSSLNQTRHSLAGCGTTSDALSFGGYGSGSTLSTTEQWSGSSWVTTTSLNIARFAIAGCGNTSDALSFGGYTTEIWSGSSWATTPGLNVSRSYLAGCGNTSDALSFGGVAGGYFDTTEQWNGSSWVTTTTLNVAREELAGCGTTSDALSFGGYTGDFANTTEQWNGSSWTTTSSLNVARTAPAGCGTTSDALSFGGYVGTTEIWNGSSWTTTSSLNVARGYLAGCGITSDALAFGNPDTTEIQYTTYYYAWSTTSSLNIARKSHTGCGTVLATLCIGGNKSSNYYSTEIWISSSWATTSGLSTITIDSRACGTTTDALTTGTIAFGSIRTTVQIWNGSVWATTTNMNQQRILHSCSGNTSTSIVAGGATGFGPINPSTSTEIWDGSGWSTTTNLLTKRQDFGYSGSNNTSLVFAGTSGSDINSSEVFDTISWITNSNLNASRIQMGSSGDMDAGFAFGGSTSLTNTEIGTNNIIPGWVWSSIVGSWDFESTSVVYSGSKSIDASQTINGDISQAYSESLFSLSGYTILTGRVYLTSWSKLGTKQILVYAWDNQSDIKIGTDIDLQDYIDTSILNSWQYFSIELSDMNLIDKTITSFRFQTIDIGSGDPPVYYLDSIGLYQSNVITFDIQPDSNSQLLIKSIEFTIVDDHSGIVTVAGSTENATLPSISYNKILGVSQLNSGLRLYAKKDSKIIFSIVMKDIFDMVSLTGFRVVSYAGDGTNAWIKLSWELNEPIVLNSSSSDKICICINDDITPLTRFRGSAYGKTILEEYV